MPGLLIVLFAVLGLAFGSFGNVLLHRLHERETLLGRSKCPHCKHVLAWYELMPILSFTVLGGKCRKCKRPISWQYPLVEAGASLLFVLALLTTQDSVNGFLVALIFVALLLDAVFDALHRQVPDVLAAWVAICGLALAVLGGTLKESLIGIGIAIAWFGLQWAVSRGRLVGAGDVLLAAALGSWLGTVGTVSTIVLSYMLGALAAVVLLATGHVRLRHSRIAFVPFLSIAALLSYLGIGQYYLHLLGF